MLARLQDQITACDQARRLARHKAALHRSPQMREEYLRLEAHWHQLAETLDFAAKVSGFLEWRSRRLESARS